MRPKQIAFLGYTAHLTARYLQQLAVDNVEQVRRYDRARCRVTLKDGTEIIGMVPGYFRDGQRFDQAILADDRRMEIKAHRRLDIEYLRHNMQLSETPEEYRWQVYDIDAEAPQYGV